VLDYIEACEGKKVSLRLQRDGKDVRLEVVKDYGVPLGLVFDEAVFDGVRTCRNRCIFCFVEQMPAGLRPSLYIKDDDYRLSFYYGNFVTLNNLPPSELRRIIRMRLSPLYVSLHATDPSLRSYMMGGNARKGLEALRELLGRGLEIHLQVVVCPGINDGAALRKTFDDILRDYPAASVGVVPLGLTSGCRPIPPLLRRHDGSTAREVTAAVRQYQEESLQSRGCRTFFASDEFFLIAAEPFPGEEEYEGYPQLDNGIGMSRKFIDECSRALSEKGRGGRAGSQVSGLPPRRGIITGVTGNEVLSGCLERCGLKSEIEVVAAKNGLFGETVTVSGLLGGENIISALQHHRPDSRELLIPDTMLREGRFIDDLSPRDVEDKTGCRLIPVETNGIAFAQALFDETGGE
jgi:putative radical SAM enzyme (TIGR03279 family)